MGEISPGEEWDGKNVSLDLPNMPSLKNEIKTQPTTTKRSSFKRGQHSLRNIPNQTRRKVK